MAWSGSGSGTEQDPYQIDTLARLQEAGSYLSSYFVLTNDIDATATSGWNSGQGFVPIGSETNQFAGNFDGLNHTITGLYINRPSTNYQGLFGYVNNAGKEIKNIVAYNFEITGCNMVGAIVGWGYNTTIKNCVSYAGKIYGNSFNAGGIIGRVDGVSIIEYCQVLGGEVKNANGKGVGGIISHNTYQSIVRYCRTEGALLEANRVGGVVGRNDGLVEYCYSINCVVKGEGTDANEIGGLVGINYGYQQEAKIKNCYANNQVSGEKVGGLVGENYYYQHSARIENCYSASSVSGTTYHGGLVGWTSGTVYTVDSFWDTETSGQSSSAGGTGKTTAQMKTQATFTNWDFASIWFMSDTLTYPKLRSLQYPKKLVWHRKGG